MGRHATPRLKAVTSVIRELLGSDVVIEYTKISSPNGDCVTAYSKELDNKFTFTAFGGYDTELWCKDVREHIKRNLQPKKK